MRYSLLFAVLLVAVTLVFSQDEGARLCRFGQQWRGRLFQWVNNVPFGSYHNITFDAINGNVRDEYFVLSDDGFLSRYEIIYRYGDKEGYLITNGTTCVKGALNETRTADLDWARCVPIGDHSKVEHKIGELDIDLIEASTSSGYIRLSALRMEPIVGDDGNSTVTDMEYEVPVSSDIVFINFEDRSFSAIRQEFYDVAKLAEDDLVGLFDIPAELNCTMVEGLGI